MELGYSERPLANSTEQTIGQPSLVEDRFSVLNREFLSSCINNVEAFGSSCCLAPIAIDYLTQCIKLLNGVDLADIDVASLVGELSGRLKVVSQDYDKIAEQLNHKQKSRDKEQRETTPVNDPPPVVPRIFTWDSPFPSTTSSTVSSKPVVAKMATGSIDVNSVKPNEEDADEAQEKEAQAHEFVPVTENEALYSTRCKIFHKPGEVYTPRGLGQLYIQKTEDGCHRILIRADNSLGSILLNMKITKDIPVTLNLEKKQVQSYDTHQRCPISFLVKTPEQAQSLFDSIETCQKSSSSS